MHINPANFQEFKICLFYEVFLQFSHGGNLAPNVIGTNGTRWAPDPVINGVIPPINGLQIGN